MNRMRRLFLILLAGWGCLFFSGCAGFQSFTEQAFLMSAQQETQLGKELAVQIEKEYKVYNGDPQATAYLQALGNRLVAAAPRVDQKYTFKLVDSPEVNAFAIPGGYCYVQLGLLRAADNEAELASVVAHEIGHVVARHGARALSRSKFYDMAGIMVLGESSGELTQMAAGIVKSGILLVPSREDELEADNLSIYTLPRAGINPEGLIWFFQKINNDKTSGSSYMAQFFSSHPLTSERIQIAQQQITALGKPLPNVADDSTAFEKIKERYPTPGK